MIPVTASRIERIPQIGTDPPRLRVALPGIDMTPWLPGFDLEAAFRCPQGGFLLFSTNDVPFEESLNIILLDGAGQMVMTRSLGAAYATGHLRDVAVIGAHAVAFSFFAGDRWVAEVASSMLKPEPRWLPRFLRRSLRVKRLA